MTYRVGFLESIEAPETTQISRYEVRAEVVCLLCGRELGELVQVTRSRQAENGVVTFRLPGDKHRAVVARLPFNTRCSTCGGNGVSGEVSTRAVRVEPARSLVDAPRRGRPPKWLVAERNRLAELERLAAIEDELDGGVYTRQLMAS